ncbi:MAG: GNAT family N-acetyltransferase [Acholeplasma sp.]|jgi:ribosomal protein S18 acetylase RimI-like enzyme|nr:MAG: GNAT family N-acetyltransferase [Acholeplasma sp.]
MIKKVTQPLINKAVRFATKMNQNEETKSSFLSSKKSLVKKDFLDLAKHNDHMLLCDYHHYKMGGLLACYKHPHQDYIDCAGPFYKDASIGKALIEEVLHMTSMKQHLIFFFDHRHQGLITLIESLGGYIQGNESQLILERHHDKNLTVDPSIQAYDDSLAEWIKVTHAKLFPEGYIPIDDIVFHRDSTRKVTIIYDKKIPVGYLILKSYPDFLQRMTIEMIGVIEGYRHQGYGRALLSHAIRECFLDPRVTSIDLIVENVNTHALNLYTHLGFHVSRKNVNMVIPKKI